MSLQANPLLYLNMGGEMLYVLRQRLKAQKIAIDKSVQVLDEVTSSVLNPEFLSKMFRDSAPLDLLSIRASLESAVLSSIMRLDKNSMNKLFDLMTMMVKYQLQMATGPRELLLITLNHMDAMRDMLVDPIGHQSLAIAHRMLMQLYGNLTYEEMWQARQACLIKLDEHNVRVSILLRLGLQREDGSFVVPKTRKCNERYEERREDLWNVRLLENSCQGCNVGSLQLLGERVTQLGTNVYSSSYGLEKSENRPRNAKKVRLPRDGTDTRAELGMLAVQLGKSELSSNSESPFRPFTLQLFSENSELVDPEKPQEAENSGKEGSEERRASLKGECQGDELQKRKDDLQEAQSTSNKSYKDQLENIYSDFIVEEKEPSVLRRMELLELMDQLE